MTRVSVIDTHSQEPKIAPLALPRSPFLETYTTARAMIGLRERLVLVSESSDYSVDRQNYCNLAERHGGLIARTRAVLLNAAQIIARSLSKCGWMEKKEEGENCVAFVSFCHFAPLRCVCRTQMRRDIDGGVVVFSADGDFVREGRERRFKRQIVCLLGQLEKWPKTLSAR